MITDALTILSADDMGERLKKLSHNVEYTILDENFSVDGLDKIMTGLYETPYSDVVYMSIYNSAAAENACRKLFMYENGVLKHILLFRYYGTGKCIEILNNCFRISMQDAENVRNIIFGEYGNVKKITVPYIFLDGAKRKPRMTIMYERLADMVIELPESMDEYMRALGPNTRKHVKYYRNRIEKDMPGFRMSFCEGRDISYEQIAAIVKLNRKRMESRGKVSGNDDAECERLYRYARVNGVLCLCAVDETIIGGTINWITGRRATLRAIAHDNAYSRYNAGQIALIGTVRHMIERRIKYLHLLWDGDRYEYKQRFLGKKHELHDVMFFRNGVDFFLNRIATGVWLTMKIVRRRLEQNETLKNIYRKMRKFVN
jgi:CelD/BcsL family acetyltransferase involved in cellulose biosynthesis